MHPPSFSFLKSCYRLVICMKDYCDNSHPHYDRLMLEKMSSHGNDTNNKLEKSFKLFLNYFFVLFLVAVTHN